MVFLKIMLRIDKNRAAVYSGRRHYNEEKQAINNEVMQI